MKVDIEKTKNYYNSITTQKLCDCDYCKNYYLQIKFAYPEVARYLEEFGIDIEKPYELAPLSPDNNILEYCGCQYIVFGSCKDTYNHKIGDVCFHLATSFPNTGIREEHFVIEFYPIKLNYIFST